MQKRGQVTLLVIIGIILLIVVGIILSLQRVALDEKLNTQAQASINDFLEVNAINYYVTSCLDRVSTQGLVLLGEQGGVIYDYQGGLTNSSGLVKGRDYIPYSFKHVILNDAGGRENISLERNVSYVIGDVISCPSFFPYITTNYSIPTTSFHPVRERYLSEYESSFLNNYYQTPSGCKGLGISNLRASYSGYLGSNNLAYLCEKDGPNDVPFNPLLSRTPACRSIDFDNIVLPDSFQRQLQSYVANNLGTCVNFSHYTEMRGNNISVDENKTNVSIVLQYPKGMTVRAKYPFTISINGHQPIVQQILFQKKLNVNIASLYWYTSSLVEHMVRDPFFNLMRDWNNVSVLPYYKQSFNLTLNKQACSDCLPPMNFDDVISIKDFGSRLKGQPLLFTFGVKERAPALEYMHEPTQYAFIGDKKIDYLYYTNSTVRFFPNATDPDGDNFTYDYHGWNEDYYSYLNWTCCTSNPCSLDHYTQCVVDLKDSEGKNISPHNWTNSMIFSPKTGFAEYKSLPRDAGLHEVTISVKDEHGYEDFQNINLLIFDLPQAILNGSNDYDDVNNSFASVEDNYTLDASGSIVSIMAGGVANGFSAHIFQDELEPFFFNLGIHNILNLPFNQDKDFFLIPTGNFSKKRFDELKNMPDSLGDEQVHNISLIVQQETPGLVINSPPTHLPVTVTACLPHGYLPKNIIDSFEYNKDYPVPVINNNNEAKKYYWGDDGTDEKLFQNPHVCCEPLNLTINYSNGEKLEGGKLRTADDVCFDITDQTAGSGTFISMYPLTGLNNLAYLKGAYMTVDGVLEKFNETTYTLLTDLIGGLNYVPPSKLNELIKIDEINDVFKISFQQKCSGLRGNICAGDFNIHWGVHNQDSSNTGECADLSSDGSTFARCEGPGNTGTHNSYTDQDVGNNLLLNPNPNNVGNIGCVNYSSNHSFEKDVLFKLFDENNLKSVYKGNYTYIENGLCSAPESAQIKFQQDGSAPITKDNNGAFKCGATCDGNSGSCTYHDLDYCKCNRGDCEGVTGSQLFDPKSLYCVTGQDGDLHACVNQCESRSYETTKEGCYCKVNNSQNPLPLSGLQVPEFFESSLWESTPSNNFCCASKNQYIYSRISQSGAKNCYDGKLVDSGSIHTYNIHPKAILSCDGQFLFCCNTTVTANCAGYSEPWINKVIPPLQKRCDVTCVNGTDHAYWQQNTNN